jgi:predicted DNA-binding protein (MmcQ/YjbR family)
MARIQCLESGHKVFAIGGWVEDRLTVTFKVNDIAYEILKEQPGLRPAPYLASRGMKWIQHFAEPGLTDDELREYSRHSCRIVSQGLSGTGRSSSASAGESPPHIHLHHGERRRQAADLAERDFTAEAGQVHWDTPTRVVLNSGQVCPYGRINETKSKNIDFSTAVRSARLAFANGHKACEVYFRRRRTR